MDKKQRIFLYERKEILILAALACLVALFSFTLGVHLGKKVTVAPQGASSTQVAIEGGRDAVPSNLELQEQQKLQQGSIDESLQKNLQKEVGTTGIRTDISRPVELPKETIAEKTGKQPSSPAVAPVAKTGKYTLQVGSYLTEKEADERTSALDALGMKPFRGSASVSGKQRFRVYLGGFPTKREAEEAARRYQKDRVIDSFLVVPTP
jgi:cell division protein FtsN